MPITIFLILFVFLLQALTSPYASANDFDNKEIDCLTSNIYHESRNQILQGQVAVALVTMNRVKDKRWPNTVCEVISQGPLSKKGKGCQFSWYCDKRVAKNRFKDKQAYQIANTIAFVAYNYKFPDFTDGSTHYHADYVNPVWSKKIIKIAQIDNHIFYRD